MSAPVWHDLECGGYRQDLRLWMTLAHRYGSPILDIGSGTGRVSLALAEAGFAVTALDSDPELLSALRARAGDLPIQTVHADARSFELSEREFALILVPMQTLQLLGGADGHRAFMEHARRHLLHDGALAVAVVLPDNFEEFQWTDGDSYPLPDTAELGGHLYSSQPTAVRREGDTFVLERRREAVTPEGARTTTHDRIALDVLTTPDVERAAQAAGLRVLDITAVEATPEHVGSEVVIFGA